MVPNVRPLTLAPAPAEQGEAAVFCSHCARSPEAEPPPRVCPTCGMGVILRTDAGAAPKTGDPFLVIDSSLTVSAMSRRAEQLLGTSEVDAVNRHIGEYLTAADVEAAPEQNLAAALAWAARGDEGSRQLSVRPANTFGVRWTAVVAPCGPPNGALLVLPDAR
jgi:PAS domain-containing protein